MLFRDKVDKIPVEAEQWFPGKKVTGVREMGELAWLDRTSGDVPVEPGDFIIRTVEGGVYAVSEPVFFRVYEKMPEVA